MMNGRHSQDSSQQQQATTTKHQSLLDLVQHYESAGWLNGKQAYEFTTLLQKTPELHEYVAQQLQIVVATAAGMTKTTATTTARGSGGVKANPPSISGTASMMSSSNSSIGKIHPTTSFDESAILDSAATKAKPSMQQADERGTHVSTTGTSSNITSTSSHRVPLILEPSELLSTVTFDDDKTFQQLFAEMCFFARLGFVQPPSCLHCTYQEGMERREPSMTCTRWVVWRKNADILLHPDKLSDNIMLIQCHAVRKLLTGHCIEGHEWDAEHKQMVVQRE